MTFQDVINIVNQYAQTINLVLLFSVIGILIQAFTAQRNAIKEQTEVLTQRINFLQDQLDTAKTEPPLVFAENLKKKLMLTEDQYMELNKEFEEALKKAAEKDETIEQLHKAYTQAIEKAIQPIIDSVVEMAFNQTFAMLKNLVDKKVIVVNPEILLNRIPQQK